MGVAVSVVAATGATTILWSLWDGRAGNLMFDGASFCENNPVRRLSAPVHRFFLVLYGCAFVVYVFSVIPSVLYPLIHTPRSLA